MPLTSPQNCFLLDGPLLLAPQSRAEMARAMATSLIAASAYADHGEAFRCLEAEGYSVLYIVLCIDDARQIAVQRAAS